MSIKRILLFGLSISFFLCTSDVSAQQTYAVRRVIDGDSLQLTNGQFVRLIGIDTPESTESSKARKDSERTGRQLTKTISMGQDAKNFVQTTINLLGPTVELEFDKKMQDKFGNLRAYVYLPPLSKRDTKKGVLLSQEDDVNLIRYYSHKGEDRVFLNASIIRAGYAKPMVSYPNIKYSALFKKLYTEAKQNR